MSWTSFKPYESGGYVYPLWANVVGVSFLALCILPLPLGALFNVAVEQKGPILQVSAGKFSQVLLMDCRTLKRLKLGELLDSG